MGKKKLVINARTHKDGKATKANVDDLVFGKKIKKLANKTSKAGTGKSKIKS